jgi:hypothetical protein
MPLAEIGVSVSTTFICRLRYLTSVRYLATASTNPASSEPIGGRTDLTIGTVEMSLAALKEFSSLAGKIPYIAPVAGIILQALKMRDVSTPLWS